MTLDQKIEGVLFYKAEPVKKSALLKLFEVDETKLKDGLETLRKRQNGALTLVETDNEVELVLGPEFDELTESLRKEELKRDIGKAGAETLAIVLYRGPVSRSEIDHIRGVNSSYILRSLEIRGLVERSYGGRQTEFKPTTELLKHLGIKEKTELNNYQSVMDALHKYEEALKAESE